VNVTIGEQNKVTVSVPKVNYLDDELEVHKTTLKIDDLKILKGLPRASPIVDIEDERPKSPWSFNKSIFATYTIDNEETLLNCFDFDWYSGKLEKVSLKYSKE
jgi:hypothetical protein